MTDILGAIALTAQAYRDSYRKQRPKELIVAAWKKDQIDPVELQAWQDAGYVVRFVEDWSE
jgi:hypothetical protein